MILKTISTTSLLLSGILLLTSCQDLGTRLRTATQRQEMQNLQDYGIVKPAAQTVAYHFPPNSKPWKLIDASVASNGLSSSTQFIPKDQSPSTWNETLLTTIVPYANLPDFTIQKALQAQVMDAKMNCKSAHSRILTQNAETITFILNVYGCPNVGKGLISEYQIGKIFRGVDAIYVSRYSAVMGRVSQAELNTMTNIVKSAKLIKNPAYRY